MRCWPDPDRVAALGVDAMLVSVNGVSPASYTAFHPNLRASDFARLEWLLTRWRQLGVAVKHVQVINRDTAAELVDMVHFAARHGARQVTFKLASLGNGTEACAITEAQRVELREQLVPAARAAAAELGVVTNLEVFAQQLTAGGLATTPIEEVGCFMGWHYARITVEGALLYCCAATLQVGHLDWGRFRSSGLGRRGRHCGHRCGPGSMRRRVGSVGSSTRTSSWRRRFGSGLGWQCMRP